MDVTLLGTGSPLLDAHRAGPATLVRAGGHNILIDAGRGVLMRATAAGVQPSQLEPVLLTHLHSDHITDLNDLITTRWVMSFEPDPLVVVGPPGTQAVIDALLVSLAPDISYRIGHHDDLNWEPPVDVTELTGGTVWEGDGIVVTAAPTDHRPVEPSVGFRVDHDGNSVVLAGDTVPCPGLDRLCDGADALVHTAIRKDVVESIPVPRLQDVLDYHSSVEQAAATAARNGVGTLILTHYVPTLGPDDEPEWRRRAAENFDGVIEMGDDLHRIQIG